LLASIVAINAIIVGLVIWAAIDAPNNLKIDYRRSRRDRLV
jgi:hypothetical protein